MVDQQKVDKMTQTMKANGIDLLLCKLPENVLYLSGFWPAVGFSVVFIEKTGEITLITSKGEVKIADKSWANETLTYQFLRTDVLPDPNRELSELMTKVVTEKDLSKCTIGFEGSFEQVAGCMLGMKVIVPGQGWINTLKTLLPGANFVDATSLLYEMRMVKTSHEIEAMTLANEIACFGLTAGKEFIKAGVKESEIASVIEGEIQSKGIGFKGTKMARGFAFVMSGPNGLEATRAFCITSDRVVEEGDSVLIELNTYADGYYSDLTRTYFAGEPSEEQKRVFETLKQAQSKASEVARDGCQAESVDKAARDIIEKAGFGEYFTHHTGHGIGLCVHEGPSLHPRSEDLLSSGMVVTLEPGIYKPGVGGVRIEDNFLVTKTGTEVLYNFPSD